MSGYWADPERNRQVLVRRPTAGDLEEIYFRTGDTVRVREDGHLTFVARSDLQVKVRGHRVELEEVEAALLTLDPVEEAAVFTIPDAEGSSALQSAVVVADDGLSSQRQILSDLRKILPLHAVPASITIVENLPRTPTGKIDRNALRGRFMKQVNPSHG